MALEGFTLTGPAFPVSPATLPGFTITGFAWVDIAAVAPVYGPVVTDKAQSFQPGADKAQSFQPGADKAQSAF